MEQKFITIGSASEVAAGWLSKNPNGTIPLDGTITMYANNGKTFVNYVDNSGTVFHQPLKYNNG